MALITQNTGYTRMILITSTADHITGLTGQTPVITLYKGTTSSSSSTGTIAEATSGWYKWNLTSNDSVTLGDLAVSVTSTAGDPTGFVDQIVAVNYSDAVRFGMSALPNVASGTTGGLWILGTNSTSAITIGPLTSTGTWTIPSIASTGTWNVINITSTGTWSPRAITSTGAWTVNGGITADRTGNLTGNITGNLSGSVGSLTANNDKTGYTIAAGGIPSGGNVAAELNNIADAILDRNMASGADSGTDSTSVRTLRQGVRILRNKVTVTATSTTGGNIVVTKEDDATTSWTGAITYAANDPITTVNPA